MEKTLAVIEQRTVEFYGDELLAVRAGDGHVYVSLRHLCDALGLARQGQVRRIRDDNILSEGYQGGNVLLPPSPDGRGGGMQKAGMLRVDLVPLWLSGVRIQTAKEEIRPKLERFQREAAKVLWEAFQEGRLTADPTLDDLLRSDSDAVQAYRMLQALVKLARNQILLEAQLQSHAGQLDAHGQRLTDHGQLLTGHGQSLTDHGRRLEDIEATLGDTGRLVTPDQASQISQAVKAVALALGRKSGRNEFGAIYGELYRKFGITGYKQLPAAKFQPAMDWLTEWHEKLEGPLPF